MDDDLDAAKELGVSFGGSGSAEKIRRMTEAARGNNSAAARILGMSETARAAGERIAREDEARRARMFELLDGVGSAEREGVDREKRSVELAERLLQAQVAMAESQSALVQIEQLRTDEARHDRKIQYAVLILSALALTVGVIALFT